MPLYPSLLTFPSLATFPSSAAIPGVTPPSQGLIISIGDLSLTGTDANGCIWRTWSPLVGWDGAPASSRQWTQRSRSQGAWSSTRNTGPRSIALNGSLEAPDQDALQVALDQLTAAVTIEDTLLTVQRGAATRTAVVARQDEVLVTDVTDRLVQWSVQVGADDPRKFASALTGSTALPSVSGGFTFPHTFPLTIATTVNTGRVMLTNPGNAAGLVLLRIDGPVVGPRVDHQGPDGTTTTLGMDAGYTLNSGGYLLIDPTPDGQVALEQGQASRNAYISTRQWHRFDPGLNTWFFSAPSGSGLLTVTASPAWI